MHDPSRREVLGAAAAVSTLLVGGCGPAEGVVLPDGELPALPGLVGAGGWPVPGFGRGIFRGGVTVLNVWASWCPYCRGEHGVLMDLSRDPRFRLAGLVFQDRPSQAASYLLRAGNPFRAVASDPEARLARALGQRGVPATYVVDRAAKVVLAIRGAVDGGAVRERLMPAVNAARAAPAG